MKICGLLFMFQFSFRKYVCRLTSKLFKVLKSALISNKSVCGFEEISVFGGREGFFKTGFPPHVTFLHECPRHCHQIASKCTYVPLNAPIYTFALLVVEEKRRIFSPFPLSSHSPPYQLQHHTYDLSTPASKHQGSDLKLAISIILRTLNSFWWNLQRRHILSDLKGFLLLFSPCLAIIFSCLTIITPPPTKLMISKEFATISTLKRV